MFPTQKLTKDARLITSSDPMKRPELNNYLLLLEREAHPGTDVVLPSFTPARSIFRAVGRLPVGKQNSISNGNRHFHFTGEISPLAQP